jgi:hypothetical protein
MATKTEKMMVIPPKVFEELLAYITSRPYSEVGALANSLSTQAALVDLTFNVIDEAPKLSDSAPLPPPAPVATKKNGKGKKE